MAGTITALRVQKKNKERVNVYIDEKYAFAVGLNTALDLRKGQQLTDAQMADWIGGYAGGFDRKMAIAAEIRRRGIPLTLNAVMHRQNLDALDHEALVAQQPQALRSNPDGQFQLWRIGDAVASRNTHAAILDALRLMVVH